MDAREIAHVCQCRRHLCSARTSARFGQPTASETIDCLRAALTAGAPGKET